jgi:hypothetical protein
MPKASVPSWLEPSMWHLHEVPSLILSEEERLPEEEPDEPHMVDGGPEEPQP